MLSKILKTIGIENTEARRTRLRNDLIRHEAQIGGELFGPVPEGTQREFFCLDEYTWIWFEEWTDDKKQKHSRTVRYDIRPYGVTKLINNGKYETLNDLELVRLYEAMQSYEQRVNTELYQAVA